MTFKQAKIVTLILVLFAVVLCVVGIVAFEEGSAMRNQLGYIATGAFAVGLVVMFLWCRCPHCGRRIIRGALLAVKCPGCGKALDPRDAKRLDRKK
jgi:hypothetical protein